MTYRVTVAAGSLRLGPAQTDGVVLDVPLVRIRARPLGRAGSAVVEVDESPLLLDFSAPRREARPAARLRHLIEAGRGRRRRDLFLRAVSGGPA